MKRIIIKNRAIITDDNGGGAVGVEVIDEKIMVRAAGGLVLYEGCSKERAARQILIHQRAEKAKELESRGKDER